MKTFAIHTFGCKVNQYESEQIRQVLEDFGLTAVGAAHQPELVIINSCCVTHIASSKSRNALRKAQKAAPDALVILTGCLPIGQHNELTHLSGVLIVKDKNTLPVILDRLLREQSPAVHGPSNSKSLSTGKIKDKNRVLSRIACPGPDKKMKTDVPDADIHALPPLSRFAGHSRAFLKVQDGCDAYCTYCIIPKIRKNVCNRSVKSVVDEAQRLVAAGHKEIVLTGICLGAYGQTTARRKRWNPKKRDALADLTDAVARIDGLKRLRLSSLGPPDVTDTLLEIMRHHTNIMPHLHLSLQSGSDNILRKMARQYRVDDFLRVVERIQAAFDRPAVTTDIIVGFPGETETDFEQTLNIAERVGFAKIHVFSFSPRRNTAAFEMAKRFGDVDARDIKRRSAVLQALDKRLQEQFRQSCSGLKESVLIETARPPRGRCGRYFMVDVSSDPNAGKLKKGDFIEITLP